MYYYDPNLASVLFLFVSFVVGIICGVVSKDYITIVFYLSFAFLGSFCISYLGNIQKYDAKDVKKQRTFLMTLWFTTITAAYVLVLINLMFNAVSLIGFLLFAGVGAYLFNISSKCEPKEYSGFFSSYINHGKYIQMAATLILGIVLYFAAIKELFG